MINLKEGAYYIDATGIKRGPILPSKKHGWHYDESIGFFGGDGRSLVGNDPNLVSAALATRQQFGDLTDAAKGALLLAQHQGKVIQEYKGKWHWCDLVRYTSPLSKYGVYRVKTERITGSVEVVDGKPDFNTWKENK